MTRVEPALTIVGGFALALGIPTALAPLQLAHAINRTLPFHEGETVRPLSLRCQCEEAAGSGPTCISQLSIPTVRLSASTRRSPFGRTAVLIHNGSTA